MCYFVQPITQRYAAFWDRVPGGVERIPVMHPEPRITPSLRQAYRLNAAALNHWQQMRLINWYARIYNLTPDAARWEVLTNFDVWADEVELIKDPATQRPGLLLPNAPRQPRFIGI